MRKLHVMCTAKRSRFFQCQFGKVCLLAGLLQVLFCLFYPDLHIDTEYSLIVINVPHTMGTAHNINSEDRGKQKQIQMTRHPNQHVLELLYTAPDEPDLSIGNWLRTIIHTNQNHTKSNNRTDELDSVFSSDGKLSSPLSSCSPTSQIQIYSKNQTDSDPNIYSFMNHNRSSLPIKRHSATTSASWIIKTIDEYGVKKLIGGDEFYITYTDRINDGVQPTAVAITTDHHDGTYTLDFVGPPYGNIIPMSNITGEGSISISLLYTCGIGRMTRPSKDHWDTGGHLFHERYTYRIANATAPLIRPMSVPNTSPKKDNGTRIVDLSKHDRVICFGDSILQNFCGRFYDTYMFRQPNMYASDNVGNLVRGDTLSAALDILDRDYGKILNRTARSRALLSTSTSSTNERNEDGNNPLSYMVGNRTASNTALIVDSAAWELGSNMGPLESPLFNNSVQMYYDYVRSIRARYPHVTLYWKSPQAVHPSVLEEQCYNDERCFSRVRYVSLSSMEYLYREQKRIMRELDVPFLDLWEASYISDTWHMGGDAFHYRHWFNMYLLNFYYPESMKIG